MPSISGMRMSETMSGGSPTRSSTPQRLHAGAGLEALKALRLEHADEEPSHPGLVVHDETLGGAGHDRLRVLGLVGMVHSVLEVGDGCHEHPIAYTVSNPPRDCPLAGQGSGLRRGSGPSEDTALNWGVLFRTRSTRWAGLPAGEERRCQVCRRVCGPSTSGSTPSSTRPSGTRWRRSFPASPSGW